MFDFEKLDLYQELRKLNLLVYNKLRDIKGLDPFVADQWKRASLSSVLNLSEGTGRMAPADKKNFYTIARGSIFECAAILDFVRGLELISSDDYEMLYAGYEKASKMLLGMYRSQ